MKNRMEYAFKLMDTVDYTKPKKTKVEIKLKTPKTNSPKFL